MSRDKKDLIAKIVRGVAIPPTFVLILSVFMYFFNPDAFRSFFDLAVMLFSLAICPALAYPLAKIIPHYKSKGRAGSRSLAFITSALGYTTGTLFAFLSGASEDLKFIFVGYITALAALTLLNKLFKLKASGHACGIVGPLLYTVYYFGAIFLIPCALIAALVAWASVYRKSHTPKELFFGALCALAGFFTGFFVIL